jgi:hypothetical protein
MVWKCRYSQSRTIHFSGLKCGIYLSTMASTISAFLNPTYSRGVRSGPYESANVRPPLFPLNQIQIKSLVYLGLRAVRPMGRTIEAWLDSIALEDGSGGERSAVFVTSSTV